MEQALIYIIIGIVYGVPLLSAGIAIYHCSIFKINKMAILLGVVLSLLIYTLLFFGIATISHNDEYSQYGILFSRFYHNIAQSAYVICLLFFIGFLITQNKLSKSLKYFIYHIRYGFQITLLFFMIIPDTYLAMGLYKLGITDMALHIFAHFKNINFADIDIKNNLIYIKYSLRSQIAIMVYLLVNIFSIALPIIVRFFNYQLKMANDE